MDTDPLRELWLQSEEDEMEIDVTALRTQSRDLETAVERRNLVEMFAAGVVATVFVGWGLAAGTWLGCAAGLSVGAGAVVVAATFLRRGSGPSVDFGGTTLAFLGARRAQLVYQAELLEAVPYWYVGPLLPGLVLFNLSTLVHGSGPVAAWLVSLAVQMMLMGGVLALNRRAARQLRASIEELPPT